MILRFLIACLPFFLLSIPVSAQQLNLAGSLLESIKKIEATSDWQINYDPALVEKYSFSGQVDLNNISSTLDDLLGNTPLDWEQNEKVILVFLAPQRAYRWCGFVRDRSNGEPLPFANLSLDDFLSGSQSDINGYFDWTFSAFKNQSINLSYVGYENLSISVNALPDSTSTCPNYFLGTNFQSFMEELVITDYLIEGVSEGKNYSSLELDIQQIEKSYSNIERDLLRTIQFIPGIGSVDESATQLHIRGSSPDQNLILWEDMSLYGPGHFFGMISNVNPFVVNRVQVHKGVFSPSYENRVGGLIDLSLIDSIPNRLHAGLGTTSTEIHGYLEAPLGKKAALILGGRQTLETYFPSPTINNYSSKVFQETKVEEDGDDPDAESRLTYSDLNLKFLFSPSEGLQVSTSFFQSKDDFFFSIPFEDELISSDNVNYGSTGFTFKVDAQVMENLSLTASWKDINYSYNYDFLVEDESNDFILKNLVFNEIRDRNAEVQSVWKIDKAWQLEAGYQWSEKQLEFQTQQQSIFEQDYSEEESPNGIFHNVFLAGQYHNAGIQFDGGVRLTQVQKTGEWQFSPRINAQVALNDQIKWIGSAGVLYQNIAQLREFGENQLGVNNPVWILSEEEGDALRANKWSTGILYQQKGWLLSAEAYWHTTEGLNTFSPSFEAQTSDDDFAEGSSTAAGFDFLFRKQWKQYHVWLNYSLGAVRLKFPDIQENAFPASYDQLHNFSLLQSLDWKKWQFSLTYQFRSGLPYSKPGPAEFIQGDEENYYELPFTNINSLRLEDYHRLDVGLSYRGGTGKRNRLQSEFGLSILNILDQENIFSRNFFLAEREEDNSLPEEVQVDKLLLGITPLFIARIYW